jgi:hypothetical protein
MEFLKKHYEKIVLCVVLLGLAAAAIWMRSAIEGVKGQLTGPEIGPPPRTAPPPVMDLSVDQQSLARITNPPPVVFSGEHNLFDPVTWKRKPNGDLLKIIKTGPDALEVTNIIPLYTILDYDHLMEGSVYVIGVQRDVDMKQPNKPRKLEYARKDEKMKSGLYIVRGARNAENGASEINLEMVRTGDTNVWISTNTPYKWVSSYLADLKYDPEAVTLARKRVGDEFKLDKEPYIIVEITNDAVRVQSRRTTKVTEIKWKQSQNKD